MRHALLPLALLALCACTPRDEGKPATAGQADAPTAGEAVASNGGGPGLVRSFTGTLELMRTFGPARKAGSSEDHETDEVAAAGTISGTVHMAEASTSREVPVIDGDT